VGLPGAAEKAAAVRRQVAEFLGQFVLPLVQGGEMRVGKPISIAEIVDFEQGLGYATEELVAVDDARTAVLADVVVRPPALVLDADELHLAAAVHNLLFLCHPRTDSWLVTGRAEQKVIDTSLHFARRPLTGNRTRVLARHSLLHNVFDVTRTDIKLSWWTGSASFLGQRPPSRLKAWRSVRRVREETTLARYDELLGSPEIAPVITSLLRRSPLTQLLSMGRDGPALQWEDVVFLLRDPELARAISYHAVHAGDTQSMVAAPARFAAAFEQLLERNPREPDVRTVAAFLVHLNALFAMAETKQRDLKAKSPLLEAVLSADRAGQRPRGLATFFALPSALARVDPRVAEPPGLREESALFARWTAHRDQVFEGVGEAVIESLTARLRRHMTAVLESPKEPVITEHHGASSEPG
jgi:hypothetical protein